MRRTLGNVLSLGRAPALAPALVLGLALGLGACADDGSGGGTSTTSEAQQSSRSSGPVEATEIALVDQTGAGGTVDEVAAVLADRAAVAEFAEQFQGPAMRREVRRAIADADVPDDQVVLGAVVALGCDVPPGVDVRREDGQLLIVAQPVEAPLQECLAPVTTVGLVAVDRDEV